MASANHLGVAAPGSDHRGNRCLRLRSSGNPDSSCRAAIFAEAAGQRRAFGSFGIFHGDALPTGLRALANKSPQKSATADRSNAVEWAWAMNAAASVMGSVLAIVIAIQF